MQERPCAVTMLYSRKESTLMPRVIPLIAESRHVTLLLCGIEARRRLIFSLGARGTADSKDVANGHVAR